MNNQPDSGQPTDPLDKFDDASRKRRLQSLTAEAWLCITEIRRRFDEMAIPVDEPALAQTFALWIEGVTRFARREGEHALRQARADGISPVSPFSPEREAEAIQELEELVPQPAAEDFKEGHVPYAWYRIHSFGAEARERLKDFFSSERTKFDSVLRETTAQHWQNTPATPTSEEMSRCEPQERQPPLPPAGYLGLRVDDERRMISREGFTAVVNLQDSRIKWAIFKKLAENRDVPVAPEAIIALWDAHGVAQRPADGTVDDAVSELRQLLKVIGLTIVVKRKVGRLLAELPLSVESPKRRGKANTTKRRDRKKKI